MPTKPRNAVIAGFLGWTLDAFDFFILTFVIGDVATAFGKTRPDIALTITLALATRPIGAVIFGMMADRMGRRVPMILNVLLYSVLSVGSGLAPDFKTFLILRMLFGVALGGQWGVGASLALESVSAKSRGLVSGILQGGYAMGNLLAAVAYRTVYPAYGWRALFLLGGLPALLSVFIFLRVSESPVWHEHKTEDWGKYFRLAAGHWKLFLYLVALMGTVALISHGTQDMYPTFLQQSRHFTPRQTADVTIASMISAYLGSLFIGWISERVGRRRALLIAAVGGLVLIPLWVGAPGVWIVVGAVAMQFFVQGTGGVIPAQMNELTPGALRGFFPGLAYQLGIVCSAGITYVEAVLGERFSYGWAMGMLVAGVFVGSLFVFGLGPESKGISFAKERQSAEERP